MNKKKTGLLSAIAENRSVYLMLLPGLFFLVVFALYPIFTKNALEILKFQAH